MRPCYSRLLLEYKNITYIEGDIDYVSYELSHKNISQFRLYKLALWKVQE